MCDISHSFNWHGVSRGPSAIAELLVLNSPAQKMCPPLQRKMRTFAMGVCWTSRPTNWPFLWEDPGRHLTHVSLGPPDSTPQKNCVLFRLSVFVGLTVMSHRQRYRHRPRHNCSNRPHLCTPCVRCGSMHNVQKANTLRTWFLLVGRA